MRQPIIYSIILITFLSIGLHAEKSFAQNTGEIDESFDPFSDYNEFEQDADEEADINFFKNGRMLTLGLELGYRGFTEGFSQAYTGSTIYGVQFTYFFDLQSAISVNYVTGDHNVEFASYTTQQLKTVSKTYTGNVNLQVIDISAKYYFNTENVTRGLADLNPYFTLGAGYYVRTYNLSESLSIDPDRVIGLKGALGIEIPLSRRRAYLGFQLAYNYVQFPDENKHFIDEVKNGENAQSPVSPSLNGDTYDFSTAIGINF